MGNGFTPGPWAVKDEPNCGDGLNILDPRGRRIGHTSAVRNIGGRILGEPIEAEEAQANARLMATAPQLLEALKWFIDDIDGTHTVMLDFDANVMRARRALAAAMGKASFDCPACGREAPVAEGVSDGNETFCRFCMEAAP